MRGVALVTLSLLMGCTTTRGVQVAVAFDRAGERGTHAAGPADPATGRRVTPDDPVRIASVSKLVVAIGVMRLVETGRLDLDADVSATLGWRLRNPAFPDRPISLRMLLAHTASLRDHDDHYAVPLGETVRDAVSSAPSWDPRHGPGSGYFAYANMNFPIVASIVERATGERFDLWMRRAVLAPMRIDACFNWPTCSDDAVARAVVLTQDGRPIRDNLAGRRPACPVFVRDGVACDLARWRPGDNGALFAPQGGLRISARGLARIGRMLIGGGTIDGVRILSPASVETMLAPQWRFDGSNGRTEAGLHCRYGLSAQQLASRRPNCADDLLRDGGGWVGHAGEAYGVRSGLWIDRRRGIGIAYFGTGLDPMPPRGRSAFTRAEERLAARAVALLRTRQ